LWICGSELETALAGVVAVGREGADPWALIAIKQFLS